MGQTAERAPQAARVNLTARAIIATALAIALLTGVGGLLGMLALPGHAAIVLGAQCAGGLLGGLAVWWVAAPSRAIAAEERRQLGLLREAIAVTPMPFALYDRDDRLVAWNRGYEIANQRAFDTLKQPFRYADMLRVVHSERLPADQIDAFVAARLAAHRRGDGVTQDVAYPGGRFIRISKTRAPSGAIVGIASDITELKDREAALARSEARFRALTESAPVGIWQIDGAGESLYVNPAMRALLGLTEDRATLPRPTDVLTLEAASQRWSADAPGEGERLEAILASRDGLYHEVLVTGSRPFSDEGGGSTRLMTVVDITQLKRVERAIRRIAHHDVLTGLANRVSFAAELQEALRVAILEGRRLSLLALDLDHFKAVNDTYGHAMGDALPQAVARRLESAVRVRKDIVYRLGGDEFAIVLSDASDDDLGRLARRMVELMESPFDIDGRSLQIGVCVGIASYPEGGVTVDQLQHNADAAMYEAKRQGRSGWRRFAAPQIQAIGSRG